MKNRKFAQVGIMTAFTLMLLCNAKSSVYGSLGVCRDCMGKATDLTVDSDVDGKEELLSGSTLHKQIAYAPDKPSDRTPMPPETNSRTTEHYYTGEAEKALHNPKNIYVNKAFSNIEQAERYAGFNIVSAEIRELTLGNIYVTKNTGVSSIGISYQGEGKSVEIEYSCYKDARSWDRSEYYTDGVERTYSYQSKHGFTITVRKVNADIETYYASIAFTDYYIQICCEGLGDNELNHILDTMDFSVYEG